MMDLEEGGIVRHHLARALTRSLFIFLILIVSAFFYTHAEYIDPNLKPTITIQAHNDPIANKLAQSSAATPTIWLGTDTAKPNFSVDLEKPSHEIQFHLTGAKEDSFYQACSVEHLALHGQRLDRSLRSSLSLRSLADVLTSAVDYEYFVYIWSPLDDVETYALNSDTELYKEAVTDGSHSALDCGEQTMLIPASLMVHLSTFSP
ncbi:MAG: hypothetical protein KDJ65_33280 [Anaerolineae bacterium]|nr:hypothetical protein [Anaerolineae bacterium]